jgi:hypothetical protein
LSRSAGDGGAGEVAGREVAGRGRGSRGGEAGASEIVTRRLIRWAGENGNCRGGTCGINVMLGTTRKAMITGEKSASDSTGRAGRACADVVY